MRTESDKGADEVSIFLRFAELAEFPVVVGSVSKRSPPEPDILCEHQGEGPIAFELVELCDAVMARNIATANEEYTRTTDPSVSVLRKKFTRSYQTQHPIELLCYVSGRIVTPDSTIVPAIKPWCATQKHPFRRIWLLGRKGAHHVWSAG